MQKMSRLHCVQIVRGGDCVSEFTPVNQSETLQYPEKMVTRLTISEIS